AARAPPLHSWRGKGLLPQARHPQAMASLHEAIRMAHEAGFPDPESETLLTMARVRLNQVAGAREEALRLSAGRDPAHLALAELWLALEGNGQAVEHAKAAYRRAWADG